MKFNFFDLFFIILFSLLIRKYFFIDGDNLEKNDYILTGIITTIVYSLWVILNNLF